MQARDENRGEIYSVGTTENVWQSKSGGFSWPRTEIPVVARNNKTKNEPKKKS